MASLPTLDDAERRRATTPPWPVILAALVVGLFLIPTTTLGGYLLVNSRGERVQPPRTPATTTTSTIPPVVSPSPPTDKWQALLRGQVCDAPCIGGWACAAKPTTCTSGLTCIPGAGADRFADEEMWAIHLSAVQESPGGGAPVDPCRTRKDFWVCRSGTSICATQADACANGSKSVAGIPVTGAELAHKGLSLEVREGSSGGPLLAKTETIVDLRRGGLCRGFSAKAVGGDVRRVTYFVLPP